MLEIRINMNSPMEHVLSFKTCCGLNLFEQNLEILVTNRGNKDIVVPSYFDLEGDHGLKRIHTLVPPGEHRIEPGDVMAFYCFMDETRWNTSRNLVLYDNQGNRYSFSISHTL